MNVLGCLALAENAVDALAQHPHDIVTAMNGKTVQIDNTDAEGRLVLADSITYVQRAYPHVDTVTSPLIALEYFPGFAMRDNPPVCRAMFKLPSDTLPTVQMVDIATLTGSVMVALGTYAAGLWSNDDALVRSLQAAAKETYDERVWHMPLYSEYGDELKHDICDMKNTGKARWGGACTAAAFLQAFVEDKRKWAHLDIAGSAGSPVGNGWGVQTLVEWLKSRSAK